MFRLRFVNPCLRRLLHGATVNRDQVLEQLQVCSVEDQVFDVVDKNKAKLAVNHVSCAVEMLWQFQKDRPDRLRTVAFTKNHPQFLTLRVLAENKIALMDDVILVDMLYSFLRLNVDPHDSLVQQLISEAWLRLDRLEMECLSKFAICLSDQFLQHSRLMGHITSIVDQRLSSIDNARVLTSLMVSVSSLVSPKLRDALISRVDHLLDTMDPLHYNNPRRVVQFLRAIKYNYRPILDKCNQILLYNIPRMDAGNISIIMGLYEALQFNNCEFRLAAKQRLTELMDSCTRPLSFTKLFVALAPMASLEIRERLENTALLLADELSAHQALAVAEALDEIRSRNLSLVNKIGSVIHRNLNIYKPMELARITQSLFVLHYRNPELFSQLRKILVNFLQHSIFPYEVTMLTRVLSMLPCPQLDSAIISRVEAVMTQCSFSDLSAISFAIAKSARNDQSYHHKTISKYVELKFISVEWFEEMLLQETMVTLQRMIDQINWINAPELAFFLTRANHLCPPLMDRIASVTIEDIDKIHYSATYAILLPFSVLNYDPAQADELYDACIQRFTPHIRSFDAHLLVLLAYSLAVADRFPEELIREIFSIDFLGKLDAQLETLPDSLNMRTRLRLMELNRAVCLECPEFQVPWFHEQYCQHLQSKGTGTVSPVQQQIHKILGEVLGGINCVRAAVVSPYFHTVDFECILDKHLQPWPYSKPSTLQVSDKGKVQWQRSNLESTNDELPPGAQRVAVDFLDSRFFCKNSHNMKGEALMKKRHLEILGYHVVQIPHFEWNSMELSTQDAWKEYLKNKIFKDLSS
uniref:RAP domain-containing protein n=1 Tax=Monopterus albus TaxID=43700 RepID=A0A3Q3QEE8_MONAL